jgi:hypothetical protein
MQPALLICALRIGYLAFAVRLYLYPGICIVVCIDDAGRAVIEDHAYRSKRRERATEA